MTSALTEARRARKAWLLGLTPGDEVLEVVRQLVIEKGET